MAKDFDDFLTIDHFFDIAVEITNGFLLAHKVSTAFFHNEFTDI